MSAAFEVMAEQACDVRFVVDGENAKGHARSIAPAGDEFVAEP
jgi:hypothetical protein